MRHSLVDLLFFLLPIANVEDPSMAAAQLDLILFFDNPTASGHDLKPTQETKSKLWSASGWRSAQPQPPWPIFSDRT